MKFKSLISSACVIVVIQFAFAILPQTTRAFDEVRSNFVGNGFEENGIVILPCSDGGYLLLGNRVYRAGCWEVEDSTHIVVTKLDSTLSFQFEWEYRGRKNAIVEDAIVSRDGRYLMTGRTYLELPPNEDDDIFVCYIKADGSGIDGVADIDGGTGDTRGSTILQRSNGSIVAFGEHDQITGEAFGGRLYVRIYDTDTLVTSFSRTFPSTINRVAWSATVCENGDIAVIGHEGKPPMGQDVYFALLDQNGNLLLDRTYKAPLRDVGRDIVQVSDGSFIIIGETHSYGPNGSPPLGDRNILFMRIDRLGNPMVTSVLGTPDSLDEGQQIIGVLKDKIVAVGKFFNRRFIFSTNHCGELLDSMRLPGQQDDDEWFDGFVEDDGALAKYVLVGRSYELTDSCFDFTVSKISECNFGGIGANRGEVCGDTLRGKIPDGFSDLEVFIRRPEYLSDMHTQQIEQRLQLNSDTGNGFWASLAPPLPIEGIGLYTEATHTETGMRMRFPADGSYLRIPTRIDSVFSSQDSRTVSRSYRMISIPAVVKPSSIEDALSASLGPWSSDFRRWRLLRWNPAALPDGDYDEFGLPGGITDLKAGNAYWLVTASDAMISVSGESAMPPGECGYGYEYFPIMLDSGFNQIGCPFPISVSLSDCRIECNGVMHDLQSAIDSGLLAPVIWKYTDSGFVAEQNSLEPWEGYFISVNHADTQRVQLLIPPKDATTTINERTLANQGGWSMRFEVEGKSSTDCCTYLNSSHTLNNSDGAIKPAFPGKRIRAWIASSTGQRNVEYGSRSILSNELDGRWNLVVNRGNDADNAVTLRFHSEGIHSSPKMILVNDNEYYYTVEDGGEITIQFADGESEISLAIFSAEQESQFSGAVPRTFELRQNFPNPFNPSTTIQFQIPVRSAYQIEIFNVLGRRVKTFNGVSSAGVVEVNWDAGAVASGVYFYKATAGNFSSSKKMLFLK